MARGAKRLAQQLKSSKQARSLQRKLQDDVQSVSASASASGGRRRLSLTTTTTTDGELPIRRFLEEDDAESEETILVLPSDPDPPINTDTSSSSSPAPTGTGRETDESLSLLQAARAGDVPQVRALVSLGAAIDPRLPDGRTPLHLCAVQDDVAMAEVLLNHGADVDAQDEKQRAPLRVAIASHSFETAALLLRRGSAVEMMSVPILLDTVRTGRGSKGFGGFLAALGRRLRISTGTLLVHEAIDHGDDEALGVLLEAGFDADERDASGKLSLLSNSPPTLPSSAL